MVTVKEGLINCQVPISSRRVAVFWQEKPISGAFSGRIASFSGVFRGLPKLRTDQPPGLAISGLRGASRLAGPKSTRNWLVFLASRL